MTAPAPAYRAKIQADRDHVASTLARITTRALLEDRLADTADDRALLRHQVDTLGRQLAWMDRRTAWVSPHRPAWTD